MDLLEEHTHIFPPQSGSIEGSEMNLRPAILSALCFCTVLSMPAQTLARPGWAGFGTDSPVWWKDVSVYEIDPHGFGSISQITQHLGYIHSLGTDAILLTHFQADAAHPQSIDPAVGTLDDLADLLRQASNRNMRVLIDLGELDPTTDLNSIARYWLNQGVSGFHIKSPQQASDLQKITASYIGQRIVIGDFDPANSSTDPQLLLDTRLSKLTQLAATTIRPELDSIQPSRNLLLTTDTPAGVRSVTRLGDGDHNVEIARIVAAILFANRNSALIYYGQELGLPSGEMKWGKTQQAEKTKHPLPPEDPVSVAVEENDPSSLLSWYRRLIALHHSNATISSAPVTITLDHDDQNVLAWIRKPQSPNYKNPPVVVVCNLSAQPVHLSLKEDLQKLHLKGSFLRTILRSDSGMGPMTIDSMTLQPFAVYIGGLAY